MGYNFKNPDSPWDWYCVSQNPNITMDIIENNLDKPWNWSEVLNPNFDIQMYFKYPEFDWNLNWISKTQQFLDIIKILP